MRIDLEEIRPKLEKVVANLNFELAEITSPVIGGRLILRLFVYSPDGVNLDDCARISREVADYLDTEDLIDIRYNLEVSSLGLDRPLTSFRDFQRRSGERVKVTYREGDTSKTISGVLRAGEESRITIDTDKETITIPMDADPRGKIII